MMIRVWEWKISQRTCDTVEDTAPCSLRSVILMTVEIAEQIADTVETSADKPACTNIWSFLSVKVSFIVCDKTIRKCRHMKLHFKYQELDGKRSYSFLNGDTRQTYLEEWKLAETQGAFLVWMSLGINKHCTAQTKQAHTHEDPSWLCNQPFLTCNHRNHKQSKPRYKPTRVRFASSAYVYTSPRDTFARKCQKMIQLYWKEKFFSDRFPCGSKPSSWKNLELGKLLETWNRGLWLA